MKFEKHCGLAYKHLARSELFCLPVIDNSNQLKQSKKMYFNKGLSQASKDKVQLCLKKDLAWRTRDSRSLEVPHLLFFSGVFLGAQVLALDNALRGIENFKSFSSLHQITSISIHNIVFPQSVLLPTFWVFRTDNQSPSS